MPANVLTDPAATYAATTVLSTTKVDAESRTDAESDEIAIASWFSEVDAALIKLNAWLVGSQSGGIAGNTTTHLGGLLVSENFETNGTLTVDAEDPDMIIDKATATDSGDLHFTTGAGLRWLWRFGTSGQMELQRYNTSAVYQDTPMSFDQANGDATFVNKLDGKISKTFEIAYSTSATSVRYVPIKGLDEGTDITFYTLNWIAPHDGELIEVQLYATGAGGSTTFGMHIDENTTPACSQAVSVSATTMATYNSWTGTATFSKGERIAFSVNPTSALNNVQLTIVTRIDTST